MADYAAGMRDLHARIANAVKDAPPEKRPHVQADIKRKLAAENAKRLDALNAKVLGMMAGEQRAAAAKLLGVPTSGHKPKPKAKPIKVKTPAKKKPPEYRHMRWKCTKCGARGTIEVSKHQSMELERGELVLAKCPDHDPDFFVKKVEQGRYKSPVVTTPGRKKVEPAPPSKATKVSDQELGDAIKKELEAML